MTPRQQDILAAIIEAYAETAEPVGSQALSRHFAVSPATIRSEMAALEQAGLITHPHTSSGRVPTDRGYRLYVNNLKDQTKTGGMTRKAGAIERRIRDAGEVEQAFRYAADLLAQATSNLAVVSILDRYYQFGLSRLFRLPEYYGKMEAYEMARLLDVLPEYLNEMAPLQDRLNILIGQENPVGKSADVSTIVARVRTPDGDGYIGLVGPTRQNYREVVALMDSVTQSLEEELNE